MKRYAELSLTERQELYRELTSAYNEYKAKGLSLDLSRGKPNGTQLDISNGLLTVDLTDAYKTREGFDCRNYGILDGLPEMKEFFADAMGIKAEDIMVGGNSSLQLMYDTLMRAMTFGLFGSERPWCREEKIKWICPAPGYDRHFRITELLGFELITVKINKDGPDMDEVERLARDP
jgi:DNA-binding transcriptional MocR family regulator